MKPDVQKALLATAGRYIRKLFGEFEPRIKAIEAQHAENTALRERIDALEKALSARPMPEKGEPGPQGAPGRDADPVLVADVVRELVMLPELRPVFDLLATDAVVKHLQANPPAPGKDGRDGERGPQGEKGADGAGVAELLIDREGALVATMTDGRMKSLGVVVGRDGENGKDGRDGLSIEALERSYDSETHEVVERWSAAGRKSELRIPQGGIHHGGYWREGTRAKAAETWTHAGVAWIATRDTSDKPSRESADWQIFANKGRDGIDGKNGRDLSPAPPVKLGG